MRKAVMRLYSGLCCAILVSVAAGQAYGGAWTQEEGSGQLIATGLYYTADRLWNNRGKKQPQPTYRKYEFNPYLEYGLADGITIGANLSLQRAQQEGTSTSASQSNWGLGDSEFFVRKRLWQRDSFIVSSESMVKLPSPGASHNDSPAIGGDHPDIGTGLSAGYGFAAGGLNHFANLDTQYRYRFGRQKDQVRLAATLGIHTTERWMLMPQVFATYRVSDPRATTFTQSSADDYNQLRLQLSAVYKLRDDVSLQFGGFSDVSGKNAGIGKGILIALWKTF